MAGARAGGIALALSGILGVAASGQGAAGDQHASTTTGIARVRGELDRIGARAPVPLGNYWVTIHRVGADSAGPIDSMRTDARGRYTFTYRRWGSADAVYFASAMYDGIAYFSQPLQSPETSGADAAIEVYDTTSGPVPLHVRGRHLIISRPAPSGLRTVIEVFELSNDSSLTRVSAGARDSVGRPTWRVPIPRSARDFQGGRGDVPADAISAIGGYADVFAPFAPGIKQLSFSYTLPPDAFPLRVSLEDATSVLEVLLEDPTARASAPRLREVDAASTGGRTFRRFLAQDVPMGSVVGVDIPIVITGGARALYIAIVCGLLGCAMLVALAIGFNRR